MSSDLLEIDHISLAYDTPKGVRDVVRDLTLSLPAGHIGCLLGESGCGKTTVRAIAAPLPRRILLDGTIISTPDMQVAPESRRVGMMFQDYALFHLTVAQNVAFGLRRLDRGARESRGNAGTGGAEPCRCQLSARDLRRPAAARGAGARLLLLDEPFSNLDVDTRERLAFEVREILKATGHTAILVTQIRPRPSPSPTASA